MKTRPNICSKHWRGKFTAPISLRWLFAACLLAGSLSGCKKADEFPSSPEPLSPVEQHPIQIASPSPRPTRKAAAARLPRLEAAVKKAVAIRLKSWKASIEARDIEKHLQHYADQIDTYYQASNVNHDFIRADRMRAFEQFDEIQVQFINIEVNLETSESAIVTFDKTWNFRSPTRFSNGLVHQEILMRKIEKQWFITSERDLEVYRYHNN